jgi:hypothetical protein
MLNLLVDSGSGYSGPIQSTFRADPEHFFHTILVYRKSNHRKLSELNLDYSKEHKVES